MAEFTNEILGFLNCESSGQVMLRLMWDKEEYRGTYKVDIGHRGIRRVMGMSVMDIEEYIGY
jgi:uncharacterized protein (UPF0248 family)